MTRYRQGTRRMIIRYLIDSGSASLREMARDLGRDERVISNYLRKYRDDFSVQGRGPGAQWSTSRRIVRNRVM